MSDGLVVKFGAGRFVCPWCAEGFNRRVALARHWGLNPDCAANRNVSNQTQSKNLDRIFDAESGVELLPIQPGAHVLALVEARLHVVKDAGE